MVFSAKRNYELLLGFLLPFDGEEIIGQVDLHILVFKAGQFDGDLDLLVGFGHVGYRHPLADVRRRQAEGREAGCKIVEQAVDFALEREKGLRDGTAFAAHGNDVLQGGLHSQTALKLLVQSRDGIYCPLGRASAASLLRHNVLARQRIATISLQSRSATLAIALIASASVWTCAQAVAENVVGKTEYLQACASCHGNDGKGGGPVATELKTPPPDLTLLAKSNGGVLPSKVLHDIIDGRRTLRAHGTYEMPVWGNIFSQNSSNNSQKRIEDISEYLKAIQAQ